MHANNAAYERRWMPWHWHDLFVVNIDYRNINLLLEIKLILLCLISSLLVSSRSYWCFQIICTNCSTEHQMLGCLLITSARTKRPSFEVLTLNRWNVLLYNTAILLSVYREPTSCIGCSSKKRYKNRTKVKQLMRWKPHQSSVAKLQIGISPTLKQLVSPTV